jgi:RNase P/RNase MRP subunit p29
MRYFTKISFLVFASLTMAGSALAQQELITVNDNGTHILPASKTLKVRNIRSMKLNVVTGTGQQISYSASITANKIGMERHYGDGRLKFSVVDQVGLLEYKPILQPERREESWLKSLFTKEVRYDAKVDRAEMTLTVPDDVLLTIDSQYSDISVGGLKRALSVVGRNGLVNVKDHFGELRIDNMFGNVSIANIGGDAQIASRSSKVTADNIEGRFVLSGQSIDFRGSKLLAGANIDNHRGKNNVTEVETEVRINSNYGEIHLSQVRGIATISSQYPSKIQVDRVDVLRANIERGDIVISNSGVGLNVSVTGKYSKITGTDIKGSLVIDGERNTVNITSAERDVMIRNTFGTVNLDGAKGQVSITGNNNALNLANIAGEKVDIDQSRSSIKADISGTVRRLSITNNYGDIELGIGASYSGRFTLRNEEGLIQHNLGSSPFSEEVKLLREVTGGNTNSQNELRVVNRNGRLIVKKQ